MKILAIGPFIGDLENEIIQFRPYCKWLTMAVEWDKVYLSTHENRTFLYDFIPEENIIPIYQHLSRDEENQYKYTHNKIDKKDYNLILKTFKEKIIEKEKCNRKNIEVHNLPYSKNPQKNGICNKIFCDIRETDVKISPMNENKIVFIPSKKEKFDKMEYIYKWMMSCYNKDVVVIGDKDTWFKDDNVVLNKIDYFDFGLKYILEYISKAKIVITPLSHWTAICNLKNKKVFSWGAGPGRYREDGIYNFNNKYCNVIPSDGKTNKEIIRKCIKEFIKNNGFKCNR